MHERSNSVNLTNAEARRYRIRAIAVLNETSSVGRVSTCHLSRNQKSREPRATPRETNAGSHHAIPLREHTTAAHTTSTPPLSTPYLMLSCPLMLSLRLFSYICKRPTVTCLIQPSHLRQPVTSKSFPLYRGISVTAARRRPQSSQSWPYLYSPKRDMAPQLDPFFKQVDGLADHFIERLRKAVAIPSVSSEDARRPDVVKVS